ncbi:hypothetical protein ACF0H5_019227 [Mactra antiquata]
MKTLFLAALFIGCIMLLTIPEAAEAQVGYPGGWGRGCPCRPYCYWGERYIGRCGPTRVKCCRRPRY